MTTKRKYMRKATLHSVGAASLVKEGERAIVEQRHLAEFAAIPGSIQNKSRFYVDRRRPPAGGALLMRCFFMTIAALLTPACATTSPASPLPDLSSGAPYCAGLALWEMPGYPARIPAPSGAIEMEGGVDAGGVIDVTLKTLGTPQEIAAFYACALPYVGYGDVAALSDGERGFSYSGPDEVKGKFALTTYDLPFPDDGWDTIIRITQTP